MISGTPTATGTFSNIIVDVSDAQTPTAATAQATFSITVTATPLTISPGTGALADGTEGTSYSQTITASGGVGPYTFTLDATSGPLPGGLSFTATSTQATISGTPTATGTFSNIIVDVSDPQTPTAATAQATYSITINAANVACGTGSESELNGHYAFLLQGFDANGPVVMGGSFVADGSGNITSAVADLNNTAGVDSNTSIIAANSSYSVGSDNRGCLTLASSGGTATFRFSLGGITGGVALHGHAVEFDNSGMNVVGTFQQQDTSAFSTSAFAGSYAFGAASTVSGGGRFAVAGSLTLSSGNVSNGAVDLNDSGALHSFSSLTGTYTIASNGRGTLTLQTGSTPVHMAFYIVAAKKALIMSIDDQSVNSLFAGSMQMQASSFSAASLNAPAVLATAGLGSSAGTSDVLVGLFTGDGTGNFTLSTDENDAGTVSNNSLSGTYSVASNGRVTITAGSNPPVFYLIGANKGYLVGTDSSVTAGVLEAQSGGPFSVSSFSGTYSFGDEAPVTSTSSLSVGIASGDGAGNISGSSDENSSGTLSAGKTFTNTYTVSANGRVTVGTNETIMYLISPSKAVFIEIGSGKTNSTITQVEN